MSKTKAHQRYYVGEGDNKIRVPGVTTVIDVLGFNKQVLIGWTRKMCLQGEDPRAITDKACDIGTITHLLVENRIKKVTTDLTEYAPADVETANNGYNAFIEWELENKPEYLHSELQVVHGGFRYGGTIDLIARLNGKLELIDFKTSGGVYKEHIIQVAAYRHAFEDDRRDLDMIEGCRILRVDKKTGDFEERKLSSKSIETGWEVFKHARALYDLQKKLS